MRINRIMEECSTTMIKASGSTLSTTSFSDFFQSSTLMTSKRMRINRIMEKFKRENVLSRDSRYMP
jgi:hypothetical protein